jgi:L-alanine-DL-glutamate epimerase-like enolase superfamily enzyme
MNARSSNGKITCVEAALFDSGDPLACRSHWVEKWIRNGACLAPVPPRTQIALRIATDTGDEGCFVGHPFGRTGADFENALRPVLLGEDPWDRERLWLRMYWAKTPRIALSAADIALWDLAGKAVGMPCWKLAGGCRDKAKVYISTYGDLGSPEDYASYAAGIRKRGYAGFKIHGYIEFDPVRREPMPFRARGFPQHEVEICRAVRAAVGEGMSLTHDPGWVFNVEQAIWVSRELRKLGYEWLEDPLPQGREDSIESYARLCREAEVPICAPEYEEDYHFIRGRYMLNKACTINRIDHYYGGFTACLKAAAMCQACGMRLELHSTASTQYNLQVLGATAEDLCTYLEDYDLDPESGEKYVGANAQIPADGGRRSPYLKGLLPRVDEHGDAHIPQTPGMGMDVDWDYVNAHRV